MCASEYYQKMIGLVDTMLDEKVIGYILDGLGPSDGDMFTTITVLTKEVNLPEF